VSVINLNKARKARSRDEARTQADANAARFGLTKAEKARGEAEAAKAKRDLDGHQRE
jgi:hypothetical protein